MRLRAPALLLASLAACAITPDDGFGGRFADALQRGAARRGGEHPPRPGLRSARGPSRRRLGRSSTPRSSPPRPRSPSSSTPGATVTALELDAAVAKDPALGDSPNPFFNVYRQYSEPGGIADEMRKIAAENPDVFKLEQIGTSTLGKPILALKMTENARNVKDGTRHAILFSAVNHAREWIAAEMGRRLPGWFAENKNDPKIRELIQTRELWFLPIQNPDGYDYTFTCGVGISRDPAKNIAKPCDYRTIGDTNTSTNRFWRKTLRDNNGNGIYGEPRPTRPGRRRRPEPQLPGQARHRRRGRDQQHRQRDLPRPVRALGAREPGRRPPPASRQVHGEHQLPLRGPAAADAGLVHDRLLPARLDAVRRHHRHRRRRGRVPVPLAALVGPLRVQRRHDRQRVHELRHHRLDAGDGHVRDAGRPARLQPVRVAGRRGDRPGRVQQEPAVRAQRDEVAAEHGPPEGVRGRPEPLPGQADPGHPGQPLRRVLRRFEQVVEADDPQGARPVVHHVQRRRPDRQREHPDRPHGAGPRGRALQRGQRLLLRASPRDHPGGDQQPRPARRRRRQRDRQGRRSPAGVPLPHRSDRRR